MTSYWLELGKIILRDKLFIQKMANAEQYASKDAKKYKNFRHFEFSEESDYAEDNMNL